MGKTDPIASNNRTYLFIKNILKIRLVKHLSFASYFNQSKQPFNPPKPSLLLSFSKSFLKSFGVAYVWLKPKLASSQKTSPRKHPLISQKKILSPTSKSLLAGWSFTDLTQLLRLPQLIKVLDQVKPQVSIWQWLHLSRPSRPQWLVKRRLFHTKNREKVVYEKTKLGSAKKYVILTFILVMIVTGLYYFYWMILKDLPQPDQLSHSDQIVTTRILSRDGRVLFKIYHNENRTLVKLDNLPQYLIDATIAIEDKNFYYHHGFDISGIVRAAMANTNSHTVSQGGSTITQQLVKNRLLSNDKTFKRKIRELVIAILVENKYSKNEILEMYLNQVAYGGSVYGIEEAAQQYFGKSAAELNLAESSLLAGLPQAPSLYSPFGATPELAKERQHDVLQRMVDDNYISQEEADQAYQQPLNFKTNQIDILAPHFVFYVKQLLAQQYGEQMVDQGGLEVTTSLDLDLQQAAQKIVTDEVNKLAPLKVSNGAALVTNPATGEILAMIGSKDYFDFAHDGQVNVTIRPRQPGSSIKPLTYSLALSMGKSPSTIIDDSPVTYQTAGSPPYSPVNYDGKFHGKVSLREALASSYNVPAVKTLAEIGVSNMLDKAQAMGIDTWQDRKRFGLSLTLGGGEVKMTDMAELYSTFANYGNTVDLNPILEIKNYKGETLYRNTCVLDHKGCPENQTISPLVAYQISDILSDNQARTPAFGPQSVLYIPDQQVAVKTGTTNNLRDNWTVGYTTNNLVAVWVGNNDNQPMSYVASGITGASPIWNKIMRLLLSEDKPFVFPIPPGFVKVKICTKTNTLPCNACGEVKEALFVPGTEPKTSCQPNWFNQQQPTLTDNQPGQKRDQILDGAWN